MNKCEVLCSQIRYTTFVQASICTTFCSSYTTVWHTSYCSQTRGLRISGLEHPSGKELIKLTGNKRKCHVRASVDEKESIRFSSSTTQESSTVLKDAETPGTQNGAASKEEFPSGDLDFRTVGSWNMFVMRLKMLCTVPWQRIKKGSVLKLKLSGKASLRLLS